MARQGLGARDLALVFTGGCIGGALRLAVDLPVPPSWWSVDLIGINILGSAILGAVASAASRTGTRWWTPGIGAGVLGGFTTFSAMAAPHPHAAMPGAAALAVTLVAAPLAAAVGWSLASRAPRASADGGSA